MIVLEDVWPHVPGHRRHNLKAIDELKSEKATSAIASTEDTVLSHPQRTQCYRIVWGSEGGRQTDRQADREADRQGAVAETDSRYSLAQ